MVAATHLSGADEPASSSEEPEQPLGASTGFMAAYGLGVAASAVLVRRSGRRLPERFALADLALVTVATHKLSRLVAKESVTRPLRAPFTTFVDAAGEAELRKEVKAPSFGEPSASGSPARSVSGSGWRRP